MEEYKVMLQANTRGHTMETYLGWWRCTQRGGSAVGLCEACAHAEHLMQGVRMLPLGWHMAVGLLCMNTIDAEWCRMVVVLLEVMGQVTLLVRALAQVFVAAAAAAAAAAADDDDNEGDGGGGDIAAAAAACQPLRPSGQLQT
eukprot:737361-Pelagomonas_calceolata.AAC.2